MTDFSDEDMDLLASLPFKVGMWISYADDQDGETDDEREHKALTLCLKQFAKLHEEDSLVGRIIRESMSRTNRQWEWADQSFNVLLDIKKGMELLRSKKVPADDIKALKRCLMEVGTAVAQAFGEFGSFDDAENEGFFGKIAGRLAGLAADDKGHPMNVSAAEDSALEKLRAVLQNKA